MGLINYIKVFRHTWRRDLKGILSLRYTDRHMKECTKRQLTVTKMFKQEATKDPSRVIFQHMDAKYTYRDMDITSNKVANIVRRNGLGVRDEVAIFMQTKPEYVSVWLGLAKAGMISSLINTNHRLSALEHSLTSVNTKALIYDETQADAVNEIINLINKKNIKLFQYGPSKTIINGAIDMDLAGTKDDENFDIVDTKFGDTLLYVHTSGTTGLPKAAIIKNSRFMWVGYGVRRTLGLDRDADKKEVIYTCLPLYHLASGVLASSQAIMFGTKVALDAKFSASNYWRQAIKYEATIGQYIGELCRYLLSQPKDEKIEKSHKMRKMFGNGIRINIWDEFKERFNINELVEIYGATEGNVSTTNIDNYKGACGFIVRIIPRWLMKKIYPISLIKVDPTTGVPIRDAKTGLCIDAGTDEVGMFVGKIVADPVRAYDGYTNKEASKAKIIENVFEKGDKCFASGDLLKMDQFGYLYFIDRTGDTFRWKGENISTTQLENIISNICNACCVVYGVSVNGYEGKAGMVAIEDPERNINIDELLIEMKKLLPKYSIPIFVKIVDSLEMTPTMKLKKTGLVEDGYKLDTLSGNSDSEEKNKTDANSAFLANIYVLNKEQSKYSILNKDLYEVIVSGKYSL